MIFGKALLALSASLGAVQALMLPTNDMMQTVFSVEAESEQLYLVELEGGVTRWIREDDKWQLRREGINFMDITDNELLGTVHTKTLDVEFPDKPSHNKSIQPLLAQLDKAKMESNLAKFSSFHTRYYKTDTGKQSSAWLYQQVKKLVADSGADENGAFVKTFEHPWGQNSVIAQIPGRSQKTVVVGAHQDSINLLLPSLFAAPGADDDGSGTVTILEALRVLLTAPEIVQGKAENTLEFHWYSAEEGGLLGSQAIFQSYEKQGRDVKAMLQQDMTGYTEGTLSKGKPEAVGVITDYVDPGLTNFIKKVVSTYCDIPYVETKCGYACSDHASASKAGYPSAFVIESEFADSDHKIHTTEDKLEYLDFNHMRQHAKLTLAFAYELAFAKF